MSTCGRIPPDAAIIRCERVHNVPATDVQTGHAFKVFVTEAGEKTMFSYLLIQTDSTLNINMIYLN